MASHYPEHLGQNVARYHLRPCYRIELWRLLLRVRLSSNPPPQNEFQADMKRDKRFPASLAGLLWRDILGQKGLSVGAREFVRWNTVPMMVTTVISCLVVAAEVCIMYKT